MLEHVIVSRLNLSFHILMHSRGVQQFPNTRSHRLSFLFRDEFEFTSSTLKSAQEMCPAEQYSQQDILDGSST